MPRLAKTNVRTIHGFSCLTNGFCIAFNLGLIYKEYVLVKGLVVMFPVMFISSVCAEDEKELMVEIFGLEKT